MINITIPVFNRLEKTQLTILALRKTRKNNHFVITVVNNGSDTELSHRLVEFKRDGIIDNLFVLKKNMGIACAANIGWRLVDAPYYMKLDNDVVVHEKNWLSKIFAVWQHGEFYSTIGGAYDYAMLTKNQDYLETQDGILGICTSNLPGHAILIPKHVSDNLGYWNEDYGLYGAEDGDYGARMQYAGYKQYYYNTENILTHIGTDDNFEYTTRGVNKQKEHKRLFIEENGAFGLFNINSFLYKYNIRSLKVPLRYEIIDIDSDNNVLLKEYPEYTEFRKRLEYIRSIISRVSKRGNPDEIYTQVEKFKNIILPAESLHLKVDN